LRKRISLTIALFCAATTLAKADDSHPQSFLHSVKPVAGSPNASNDASLKPAKPASRGGAFTGRASWYGGGEKLARHTASGEVFHPDALTAAHRSLPLGTRLVVSANGRSIVVRVNDRGPAKWTGRSLDLSRGAARALGIMGKGTALVSYRVASL